MSIDRYVRERRKMMSTLADHFHDKVLEVLDPELAGRWAFLADAALWIAHGDGEGRDLLAQLKETAK